MVALLGVAVQAALIAGRVVEYGVGEGAKRVGGGVLAEKMGKIDQRNIPPAVGEGLTQPVGTIKGGATTVGGSVGKVIEHPLATAKSAEKSLEKTLQEKGIAWAVKKMISVPVAAVPVVGPIIYAMVNSGDLGRGYVEGYAKSVGVEKEAQDNSGSIKGKYIEIFVEFEYD